MANGNGGESIYGSTFTNENYRLRFSGPGHLAMANIPGTNQSHSQFFVTLGKRSELEHLDGTMTVFGKVLEGWSVVQSLVKK